MESQNPTNAPKPTRFRIVRLEERIAPSKFGFCCGGSHRSGSHHGGSHHGGSHRGGSCRH